MLSMHIFILYVMGERVHVLFYLYADSVQERTTDFSHQRTLVKPDKSK